MGEAGGDGLVRAELRGSATPFGRLADSAATGFEGARRHALNPAGLALGQRVLALGHLAGQDLRCLPGGIGGEPDAESDPTQLAILPVAVAICQEA